MTQDRCSNQISHSTIQTIALSSQSNLKTPFELSYWYGTEQRKRPHHQPCQCGAYSSLQRQILLHVSSLWTCGLPIAFGGMSRRLERLSRYRFLHRSLTSQHRSGTRLLQCAFLYQPSRTVYPHRVSSAIPMTNCAPGQSSRLTIKAPTV